MERSTDNNWKWGKKFSLSTHQGLILKWRWMRRCLGHRSATEVGCDARWWFMHTQFYAVSSAARWETQSILHYRNICAEKFIALITLNGSGIDGITCYLPFFGINESHWYYLFSLALNKRTTWNSEALYVIWRMASPINILQQPNIMET